MPAELKPLRVAVWGIGRHALRNVLPAIRASQHVRLTGVCSRNSDAVASVAREHGCLGWTSADEMLNASEIDAVYLATPVGLHGGQGLAILRSGRHLICEKSLTADKADALALVRAAREQSRLVFETFMYLHHPRFVGLKQILDSGRLGRLAAVSCHFTLPKLEYPGYRYDPALGGGALLDVGCYPVSLLISLVPSLPVVKYARLDTAPSRQVDTFGTAVLGFSGGVDAMLTWGYDCGYRNEVTLLAENGSAHLDHVFSKGAGSTEVTTLSDRFGKPELIQYPAVNSFVAMFAAIHAAAADLALQREFGERAERQADVLDAMRRGAGANPR